MQFMEPLLPVQIAHCKKFFAMKIDQVVKVASSPVIFNVLTRCIFNRVSEFFIVGTQSLIISEKIFQSINLSLVQECIIWVIQQALRKQKIMVFGLLEFSLMISTYLVSSGLSFCWNILSTFALESTNISYGKSSFSVTNTKFTEQ